MMLPQSPTRLLSNLESLALAARLMLVTALGVAAIATWRAVDVDTMPAATTRVAPAGREMRLAPPVLARPASAPTRALDNDPFSPDRQLPVARARATVVQAGGGVVSPTIAPETIHLVGTVLRPGGGSFVVYQLPSEVPKTVRVGESVGSLTLVAVAPGRATFRARSGALVEVTLIKPGG